MKVKVSYTVEVDDNFRRAVNAYYGKDGMATRKELKDFFRQNGGTIDDDVTAAYDAQKEESK